MKDVEFFFNTLAEDLFGGENVDSEENYCKQPSYEKYRGIFTWMHIFSSIFEVIKKIQLKNSNSL